MKMTSKEAYLKIQEFINDTQLGIKRSSLDIIEPLNIIGELIKEQSNPTFDDCIKEWEDKGYRISKNLPIDKMGMINNGKNYIYITLKEGQIKCGVDGWLSLEELNLLYKTIKALEVEK